MTLFGSKSDVVDAHKHSRNNRGELDMSPVYGCFYCFSVFPPSAIDEWVDDGQTAVCRCSVDAIIGSASGYPITKDFLAKMHDHWF